MRALAILLLLAATAPAARTPEDSAGQGSPEKDAAIRQYYQDAFDLYTRGDFRRALLKWTEILKADPNQKTAKSMTLKARAQIALLSKKRRQRAFAFIAAGQYEKARLELQALLDQSPGDPDLEALQAKLESVIGVAREIRSGTKGGRVAILGLGAYLAIPPDLRLAHNALRYACELEPGNNSYERLLKLLLTEEPALSAEDPITPGMKLLDYKRLVSLHQIYDGKYHLAVNTLGEILALEPDDLISLKRLGSAYYSLGKKAQAAEAWNQALKLAPDDEKLKAFLAKVTNRPRSASRKKQPE